MVSQTWLHEEWENTLSKPPICKSLLHFHSTTQKNGFFQLHIHSTTQKWLSSHGEKWVNCRKTWGKLPAWSQVKIWPLQTPRIEIPCFPFANNTENKFWAWRNEENNKKSWGRDLDKLQLRERAQSPMRMGEEWNIWLNNGLGMHSQAFTFPRSQKHVFKKWVASQIRIWLQYSSHPHALTSPTNFQNTGNRRQNC